MSAWLAAAEALKQDPVELQRRWPPRLLRLFGRWLAAQMDVPSRADWYAMHANWVAETGREAPFSDERYKLKFAHDAPREQPAKGKGRKRTPEEQAAEDAAASALWRGMIGAAATKKS